MMFVCFWSQRLNTHFLFFFKGKLFDFLFFFCHPIHRMVLNHRRVDLRGIGKELKTLVQSWMGRKQSNHLNRESELVMRFPCVGLKYKSITTFFLFSEFETVNLKKKNITSSVYCWAFFYYLRVEIKAAAIEKKKLTHEKEWGGNFFFFFREKIFFFFCVEARTLSMWQAANVCIKGRSPPTPQSNSKSVDSNCVCVCIYQ